MTTGTLTQYMVARDADADDVFVHHSVGVDSTAGLYVIDGQGRELSFSEDIQEEVFEALRQRYEARGKLV